MAVEFPKYTNINDHIIKLVNTWQSLYRPIYGLGLEELEVLKVYIKNNLVDNFIKFSKSSTEASIIFNWKLDVSLRLYVDYQSFNKLTIKNRYLLPLVEGLLD